MATLVLDRSAEDDLLQKRRISGGDRWDEVWQGVTVMPPMPDNEHQGVASKLGAVLENVIGFPDLGDVLVGANVSDREDDWTKNYRVPDIVVFLKGGPAKDLRSHWRGGPDFVVEILSPGEQAAEKLRFYAGIGTREVLWVKRDPWELVLYRLKGSVLAVAGRSGGPKPSAVESRVLPLSFRLVRSKPGSSVEVVHAKTGERWTVK